MLDLFETADGSLHFSLITDLKSYARYHRCNICQLKWGSSWQCERHRASCGRMTKDVFPSGYFQPNPTLFTKLADVGIELDEDLQYFPYVAVFDFECFFTKDLTERYDSIHVPMSFAMATNIPGVTKPVFFTHKDPKEITKSFLHILNESSDESYRVLRPRYESVFQELYKKSKRVSSNEELATGEKPVKRNNYDELVIELDNWLSVLPVIGFNSGCYDLNLIKAPLLEILNQTAPDNSGLEEITVDGEVEDYVDDDSPKPVFPKGKSRVIKRGNKFISLRTDRLCFLDISNYLGPNTTYKAYLKAFNVSERKGYFPYEYVNSYAILDEQKLPEYEDFFSKLKNCNLLDENCESGDCDDTCNQCGEQNGRDNHIFLQRVWRENNMLTIRDLLSWYNLLDVNPLLIAVQRQFTKFKTTFRMDMFKQAVTLPGLSLRYAFSTTDAKFEYFGDKHSDIHRELRNNIVGGPSIIFTRFHEVGKTFIRQPEFKDAALSVNRVEGFDANSLYLYCLGQRMPTGKYYVRHGPAFKKEYQVGSQFSSAAILWLEHEAETRGVKVIHARNGREVRIGSKKIPVDGYSGEINTAFSYLGCFYHGCKFCYADKQQEKHPYHPTMTYADVRQKTRDIASYIRGCGYTLVELWECEDTLVSVRRGSCLKTSPSEIAILDAVKSGLLFGFLKVDIKTPPHLQPAMADFPPVFKNANISRHDIGPFMGQYCRQNGILNQPVRSLISSFQAQEIVLISPLLKYYLELGLTVTRVHFVVEYDQPEMCFAPFVDQVANARRQADNSGGGVRGMGYKVPFLNYLVTPVMALAFLTLSGIRTCISRILRQVYG